MRYTKTKVAVATLLASCLAGIFFTAFSMHSTLSNKLTIFDITPKGVISFQEIEISHAEAPPEQLSSAIKIALRNSSLQDIDVDVESYSANVSRISEHQAKQLTQRMQKAFTISHEQAWELELNGTSYAVKVYYFQDTQWDIAIVSIGFQHYIDALCYSLKLPGYESLNSNNALKLLAQLSDLEKINSMHSLNMSSGAP
ncbi:MAG: hypothetical protein KME06_18935 [Kastovskya adunca ATA6-11-RM4]|jgi:hypothetical protein|nr:hypothetical protein [Kastovskya adunca ATA6-11-RM4]